MKCSHGANFYMEEKMKVELMKQQVLDIVNTAAALMKPGGPRIDQKFAYALAYNQQQLMAAYKGIQAEEKQDKKYLKYESARIELAEQHAEENTRGKSVIRNGQYVFKDQNAFDSDHRDLRKKHKAAIEDREERLAEVLESVALHGVDVEHVKVKPLIPGVSDEEDNFVDGSIMRACLPFITMKTEGEEEAETASK